MAELATRHRKASLVAKPADPALAKAMAPSPAGAPDTSAETAYYSLREAEAVIIAAAENDSDAKRNCALWGAVNLTDLAAECIPLGAAATIAAMASAINLVDQAAAVLCITSGDDEFMLVDAAMTLLGVARRQICTAQDEVRNA